MRNYVELVLKKEKKAISYDKIVRRIEMLRSEELQKEISLTEEEKMNVLDILEKGVSNLDIYKTPHFNYILFSKTSFRKGRFYGDRTGGGKVSVTTTYVDRDGKLVVNEEKIDIAKDKSNGAIDGDFVLIDTCGQPQVLRVLDRNLEFVPGEVYHVGGTCFVKPVDKKKQSIMITIPGDYIDGYRVAVQLKEQTAPNFYIAEVVKEFNHKDDPDESILWEAFKHGVDNDFSQESLAQLEYIPGELRDVDRIGREDLTGWEIFTIDGVDTKDMDDAISCRMNKKGNYELGVHITDIASIVPENSPLDKDAFRKGNSFYLGGTVLPMFPHKISNGIGSLNPNVDRMTLSCIMEINPEGEIVNYRISPTIIRSRLKMTYDKVNQILKEGVVDSEYEPYEDTLINMKKLSLILRKKRLLAGAAEFDRPEMIEIRDDTHKVVGFGLRIQDVGENLIEEFMLAANRTVDKDLSKRGIPFLHRVHDSPNEERIQEFLNLLDAINLPFTEYSSEELATNKIAYQHLLEHISKGGRLKDLLTTQAIRCMSRAKYSPENLGHYGLATPYYCHFTSPVRRYADLTDQRIIWECLFKRHNLEKSCQKWEKQLPEIAEQTSHQERVSDDTERDVLRMLCAEYMQDHVGEEFEATVTCVSSECLTVELENMMEGTVRTHDLKGSYIYCPESYSLVSLDGEENYFLGDHLKLRLKYADKESKHIEFEIVEKLHETQVQNSDRINYNAKVKAKRENANRAMKRR
ncbi:MAG: VacB/RNase II family 3'-5' exoribonuclease [Bacilli bacterium]|nr:VacB/RNase II family 3'-5' exoribonuclease [Bacilli bacterium]